MPVAASKRWSWQPPAGSQDTHYDEQIRVVGLSQGLRTLSWKWKRWVGGVQSALACAHQYSTLRGIHKMSCAPVRASQVLLFGMLALFTILDPCEAAMVNFQNCLPPNIVSAAGPQIPLQWIPLYVSAVFNESAPSHNLNVTVYGNVTGQATTEALPQPNSPSWSNSSDILGKILDVDPNNHVHSTLKAEFNVLTYTPYRAAPSPFCNSTLNTACPVGPVFRNVSNLNQLPAFTVSNDMYSTYAFTSFYAVLEVVSGDATADPLACVSASITPALGGTINNLLTYLPVLVLVLVGVATASAAIFSPWGTIDVFRWTSNYGRDADQLRLITPGFGDCLQYIQFIVLSGSLSLNYPGYYQPVVSRVSWSALMFNESFVSHGPGMQSIVDGIYVANATYGLDQMRQLVGMTQVEDVWAGMIIWLLVIIAVLAVVIQIGFLGRWAYRKASNTQEEDLRAKNLPFTAGNTIRVVFNYFLLPIVALSMFQLVVAGSSPTYTVALAAIALFALILFAAWLLWLIAVTRPRSYLFDDLPTVLLYGPLYNTYSDNAAAFALIPVMLAFLRGIAIGAVQPSGIAQLVLLAICEVVLILMLNAFRPFSSPTSMNAFHTFFAVTRLATVILMVVFVPSLDVADASRGWIGYVILLLHGIVLFVGFFLHSLQTLTEVVARLAGAGGEEGVEGGATRGGLVKVFGMRQLSRRNPRRAGRARRSVASDAAMLTQGDDQKSAHLSGGRSRSLSATSAMLLNRRSVGLDSVSIPGGGHSHTGSAGGPQTPTTPGGISNFSYIPGASQTGGLAGSGRGGIVNLKGVGAADPYYRPPRPRRVTVDMSSPESRSRGSWASGAFGKRSSAHSPEEESSPDPMEGPSVSGRGTPLPAHLGSTRDPTDSDPDDPRRSKTDYAIREVDYYYGVRGPALSHMPTRRLKTGPADPTGPVSAATGWFKNFFGGKTKEKGKGFEVVRSSRLPPHMQSPPSEIALADQTPYKDEPEGPVESGGVEAPRAFELEDERGAVGAGTRHLPDHKPSPASSDYEAAEGYASDEDDTPKFREGRVSQFPPSLPNIEIGSGIGMPSRLNSRASYLPSQRGASVADPPPPKVPRRSSKRTTSYGNSSDFNFKDNAKLSVIAPSPPGSSKGSNRQTVPANWPLKPPGSTSQRIPFGGDPSPSHTLDLASSRAASTFSSQTTPLSEEDATLGVLRARRSSSALGPYATDMRDDRPSSLGYVQQHRASDNVHIVNPLHPPISGSTAEVVDDPHRRSLTPESRQLPSLE